MAITGSAEHLSDFLSFYDLIEHEQNEGKGKSLASERKFVQLNVDYSKFSNHCWFNSAYTKAHNACERIYTIYEDDATYDENNDFYFSGSHYDRHVYDVHPRSVGYISLNESQFVTGSDPSAILMPGSGSWSFECWMNPATGTVGDYGTIFSEGDLDTEMAIVYYSKTDNTVNFGFLSASAGVAPLLTMDIPVGSWHYAAFAYDRSESWAYGYTGTVGQKPVLVVSQSFVCGDVRGVNATSTSFYMGSSSLFLLAPYSGALDEVRVWRSALSSSFISDYYNRNIYPEHKDLVLYYKFNKGQTTTASIDQNIRDYSGNDLDSFVQNYDAPCRVSASALQFEEGTILNSELQPRAFEYRSVLKASGSIYDDHNDQLITKQFPAYVIEDDDDDMFVKYLYASAELLDELQLYQEHYSNLDYVNYSGKDSCPDELLPQYAANHGFDMRQVLDAGNTMQQFFGDNVLFTGSTGYNVDDLKKTLWRRIANNIPYYLKTKGTVKSIRGLLNSVGLDERQLKIKQYSFLPGEKIDDQRIYSYRSTEYAHMSGTITAASSMPALGTNDFSVEINFIPHTTSSYTTSSILRVGAGVIPAVAVLDLYYIKESSNSGSIYAVFDDGDYIISSSMLPLFVDDRVHVSVGYYSGTFPNGETITHASGSQIFMHWATYDVDRIRYSGSVSGNIAGHNYSDASYYNLGYHPLAKYRSFDWLSEFRYYPFALTNNEFLSHVHDPRSIGTYDPFMRSASIRVPMDRLVNPGNTPYFDDVITRTACRTADDGSPTDPNMVSKQIYYKQLSQDLVWSEDLFRIRDKTELKKSEQAMDFGIISLEMNPIDALNEDIGRMFSTNRLHNETYGNPLYKLRGDYNHLRKYRNKYFDQMDTMIRINRYFDAYKWIDENVSKMVEQLVGSSKKYFGGQFVIEPHALELNRQGEKHSIFKTPTTIDVGEYSAQSIEACKQHNNLMSSADCLESSDGYKRSRFYKNTFMYNGNDEIISGSPDGWEPHVTYEKDNLNTRHEEYVNSGNAATGHSRLFTNDLDFVKMNLRYYYDVLAYGGGNWYGGDPDNTFDGDDKTAWTHVMVDPPGLYTKQVRFKVTLRLDDALPAGSTVNFNSDMLGSFTYDVRPTSPGGHTGSASAVLGIPAAKVSADYKNRVPQLNISGVWSMRIECPGANGNGTEYTIDEFQLEFDVSTTASISNDMLLSHTYAPGASSMVSYLDVDVKDRKFIPEEAYSVSTRATVQGKSMYLGISDVIGGVHYGNVFGQTYDTMRAGTKQHGTLGVTDADMIQVTYIGSKIEPAWPNQKRLQDHNQNYFLNNAYGDRTDQGGEENGWIFGSEIVVDGDYNIADIWVYYNVFGSTSTTNSIGISLRIMESPFGEGPMSQVPTLSGAYSTEYDRTMDVRANSYNAIYPTSINEGWYSYRLQFPLTHVKRIRIDVKGSNEDDNDPHLNNAVVFAQLIEKDITRNTTLSGDNVVVDPS